MIPSPGGPVWNHAPFRWPCQAPPAVAPRAPFGCACLISDILRSLTPAWAASLLRVRPTGADGIGCVHSFTTLFVLARAERPFWGAVDILSTASAPGDAVLLGQSSCCWIRDQEDILSSCFPLSAMRLLRPVIPPPPQDGALGHAGLGGQGLGRNGASDTLSDAAPRARVGVAARGTHREPLPDAPCSPRARGAACAEQCGQTVHNTPQHFARARVERPPVSLVLGCHPASTRPASAA